VSQPVEAPTRSVTRTPVEGACPECGASQLASYPIYGEGGWWDVTKCQACLASVARVRGPLLGSYRPHGLETAPRGGPGQGS
jgi:hypothetical protein